MREKLRQRFLPVWGAVKRGSLRAAWMLAVQLTSCLACWGVLLLYGRNFELEWLVYGLGALLPFLWGTAGYWFPKELRLQGRWKRLALWTVLLAAPAALSWWADKGGPEGLGLAFAPQLMARLAWFYPLFNGPRSAFVLETLQPLTAAGTHLLLMFGFWAGLRMGRRRAAPKRTSFFP